MEAVGEASSLFVKNTHKAYLDNIAALTWGLLIISHSSTSVSRFRQVISVSEACRFAKRWCKTTQCSKRSHRSTMIHWQTWDFQHSQFRPKSTFTACCSRLHLLFSWQSVGNTEGRVSIYILVRWYFSPIPEASQFLLVHTFHTC